MATKTQNPRKEKHQYLVWGEAPGFTPVGVFEYVWAYTRAQAVRLVRIRLENKYPTIRIYLGDCTAVRRDRPSPKPNQRRLL